jgi:hypothetical protein
MLEINKAYQKQNIFEVFTCNKSKGENFIILIIKNFNKE